MSKKQFDPSSMSLEERATMAFENDFGGEPDAPAAAPAKVAPLPPGARPKVSPKQMQDAYKILGLNKDGMSRKAVPPDILALYPNADYLNVDTSVYGADWTPAPAGIQEWKRRDNWLPQDIYDPALDPQLFSWFVYFMHPMFGLETVGTPKEQAAGQTLGGVYIKRVLEIAHGWSCKPTAFLRQQFAALIRDRKLDPGGAGLPNDREKEDDEDDRMENQGLAALLEYSTYSQLQNIARQFDCKPETLMCYSIKHAVDSGVFQP